MLKSFFLSTLIFAFILANANVFAMEVDESPETESSNRKEDLLFKLPRELISLIVFYFVASSDFVDEAVDNFKRFAYLSKEIQKFVLVPYNVKITADDFTEDHVKFFAHCGINALFVAKKLNVMLSSQLEEEYKRKNFEKELEKQGFNYLQLCDWINERKINPENKDFLNKLFSEFIDKETSCKLHSGSKGEGECYILGLLALINSGVDINIYIRHGETASGWLVHHFIFGTNLIELLINVGANPNIQSFNYEATPLLWAMHAAKNPQARKKKHNIYIIRLLLDASADPNVQNERGHNAFIELLWANSNATGYHFKTGKPFDNTQVYNNNKQDIKKIVRLLIKSGVDVTLRDKRGWTALKHAINNKHDQEIIEILKDQERYARKTKLFRCITS